MSKWTKIGLLMVVAGAMAYVISCGQDGKSVPELNFDPPPKRSADSVSPAMQLSMSLADAVDTALPSVVTIKVGATRIYREWFSYRYYKQQEEVGQGSGVIISKDGYIVTNRHVIEQAEKVDVVLNDGTTYAAEYIGSNSQVDIAVLKITPDQDKPLVAITPGDSDGIRVGELVLAIGAPFSLSSTVTQGIVSQKGRASDLLPIVDFIQTSAAINPGNSGGALVDIEGRLVGINTYIQTAGSSGSIGIGFAVPAATAYRVAELLIKGENSDMPYIGVITDNTRYGVVVAEVVEDSPASKAGLRRGDLLRTVNGKEISTSFDLKTLVTLVEPGETVKLKVQRDRKEAEIELRTERIPDLKAFR